MENTHYDPLNHLHQLFDSPLLLDELPELLNHTERYKHQLDRDIEVEIAKYDQNASQSLNDELADLVHLIKKVKEDSAETQSSILSMTSSIQQLDQYKKNLVLSMTVLQRLQMLINANESLEDMLSSRNYEKILQSLGVIKELLVFFQPYKSIREINQLGLNVQKTQNKLVDDIFIDFEQYLQNAYDQEDQLIYGCQILDLIDSNKYRSKLLNWFYNFQLKDIKVIFNNHDEAGSLENLNRRYIYFNNILKKVQSFKEKVFPSEWNVDFEFAKLYCLLTRKDLSTLLQRNHDSSTILDNLQQTLDFEKSLQESFKSSDFNHIISSVFEPYLTIWVKEQDKILSSKIQEYQTVSQLPPELSSTNSVLEFMTILKVNNVPNIALSSIDIFKDFQKILTQFLKLSNGLILVDLGNIFVNHLYNFHHRVLLPILPINTEDLVTMEAIKYITMLLNTGDYIINNIDDLYDKLSNLIQPQLKAKIPSFDSIRDVYFSLITKSINCLVLKTSENMKPAWRQFVNQNWQKLDSVTGLSSYMQDMLVIIKENNIMITLPLIIRESYVRNVCDKTIEMVIISLANNLAQIKPLQVIMLQQILLDMDELRALALTFTLYSDAGYENKYDEKDVKNTTSKSYTKFVNHQFDLLKSLLKLLMVPNKPIDDFVEQYFTLIKDSSISNFIKVLNLKSIDNNLSLQYLENFKAQLTIKNDSLIKSSSVLANIEDEKPFETHGRTATPELKSPKLLHGNFAPSKINLNIEKGIRDFTINGEHNISKLNENFKNIGRFFKKDDRN